MYSVHEYLRRKYLGIEPDTAQYPWYWKMYFNQILPTQDMKTAFSSPANSMLRTMMLTLGEFDFDSLFFNTDEGGSGPVNGTDPNALPQEVLYPRATYLLWIVFV